MLITFSHLCSAIDTIYNFTQYIVASSAGRTRREPRFKWRRNSRASIHRTTPRAAFIQTPPAHTETRHIWPTDIRLRVTVADNTTHNKHTNNRDPKPVNPTEPNNINNLSKDNKPPFPQTTLWIPHYPDSPGVGVATIWYYIII